MKKKTVLGNQSGVSLIIAMVFFMVITLACLTLFRVASGAIEEARRYADVQKAEILSSSMSEVVQDLIENGVTEKEGLFVSDKYEHSDGKELLIATNPISRFIYDNLDVTWPYYNEEQVLYSNMSASTRKLELSGIEEQGATGEISMYWTWDAESWVNFAFDTRKLYVTVTIYVGEEKASTTSVFLTETPHSFKYEDQVELLLDQYYWWQYDGEMR